MGIFRLYFPDGSDEKNCKPLNFEVLLIYIGIGAGLSILFGIAINSYLKASLIKEQGCFPGCACIAGIRLFSGCACDLGLRLSTVPAVSNENIQQNVLRIEEDLDDVENDLQSFAFVTKNGEVVAQLERRFTTSCFFISCHQM